MTTFLALGFLVEVCLQQQKVLVTTRALHTFSSRVSPRAKWVRAGGNCYLRGMWPDESPIRPL